MKPTTKILDGSGTTPSQKFPKGSVASCHEPDGSRTPPWGDLEFPVIQAVEESDGSSTPHSGNDLEFPVIRLIPPTLNPTDPEIPRSDVQSRK